MMRKRRVVVMVGTAVVVALIALAVVRPFAGGASTQTATVPTGIARVVRTNVVERQQVAGTLSYSGSFTVVNGGAAGTVTWMPQAGALVTRGQPLYELDRSPVALLYGGRPAYRDLSLGVAGNDVRELQQNLRALGFTAGGALQVNGRFDVATLAAVEAWQRSLGRTVTGTVPLGSVVILPGATRVSTLAVTLGANAAAGATVMTATSAAPAVLVPLDPGTISQLAIGDAALVTMPDGTTVGGHVTSIGRVASAPSSDAGGGQGGGQPTVPVTVTLTNEHAAGSLDQAPVQLSITQQEDRHVLAAPISALLAQPGGAYAVDVVERDGSARLVAVTTGLFDDVAGTVEIDGAGIHAGTRVEVPRS